MAIIISCICAGYCFALFTEAEGTDQESAGINLWQEAFESVSGIDSMGEIS